MAKFLVRRILQGLLVMVLVTIIVFGLYFVGGGPNYIASRLAGKNASPQLINDVKRRLLLNRPVYVQYLHFVWRLLHGDLGTSYQHQVPVTTILKQAFPVTASLALGASIIWLVLGVLAGTLSAVRRGSLLDRVVTVVALIFYSMPVFVLGLLLLYVFYFRLTLAGIHIFPGQGYTYFSASPLKWFEGLILPWITLAFTEAASYARLSRGSLLDVLGEDYIRTARAKGLRERRVIYRHGLRSALTPVVSQFGIDVATLLGGAILTETVFSLPGLGYTAAQSITEDDLPVIIGIVIIAAAAVIVANIIVDAFYAVLDPRVRLL
jgi:peptide/nickel transport system permease protein